MKVDLKLLKKIHAIVLTETSGRPDLMASKLGISRRFLYMNLHYMKKELGAPIVYSRTRFTFYYREEWEFYIGSLTRVKNELLKELMGTIEKF